jgi:N-glycosylase/DNA lyase
MELEVPLVGPSGEAVDLRRTLLSHGTASLPPALLDEKQGILETTIPLDGGRPRRIRIAPGGSGRARILVYGRTPGPRARTGVEAVLRRILNLDEDLSGFYALAAEDPDLAWVVSGAGRMVRAPTVFEDVVKTICTTNCSWALTTKMTTALVKHLGEPAAGAPRDGWRGRAFPTAEAMAGQPERFYRDVVRAGYRAPHLRTRPRTSCSRWAATGS